jgi:VanZ family protein
MDTGRAPQAVEHRSRLADALAALYACAIAYASLQPFGDWLAPLPGTAFWLVAPWPPKVPRSDAIANTLSYIPLGAFVALIPARSRIPARIAWATLVGAMLSFAMETLQWYLPPRHANAVDLLVNTVGAIAGGTLGAFYAVSPLRTAVRAARRRVALPGAMGDVGLALVAMWLVAQVNPAIAPFALTFDPEPVAALRALVHEPDVAATLIEAAQSAFQLLGVGLFVALLVRERSYAGGAVLVVVGIALLVKGAAAALLLKPEAMADWVSTGVLAGVAAGALLLLPAVMLPRPVQVALCAIALLSSLLVPLLTPDVLFATPPLTLFDWRFGHLLSFNGLTRIILTGWPVAAAVWLFALAGRPAWGQDGVAPEPAREPDPL